MMAGLGIKDLFLPPREFRPSANTHREDGAVQFESLTASLVEDSRRADLITSAVEKFPQLFDERAIDLANRLNEGVETEVPPQTPASHLFMRCQRNILIGHLWLLTKDEEWGPPVRADLMPSGLWVPADELADVKPKALLRRLRSDLDRTGISRHRGYILAGLHAEFDVRRLGYDFHYHLVAGGGMAESLDELRTLKKYSAPRKEPWEQGLADRPRVHMTRQPLVNLPDPLTYIMQSSYPHRPTTANVDGTVTRSSRKYRIPEPYHALWLLWMDRWSVSDSMLLVGMRVSQDGFQVAL